MKLVLTQLIQADHTMVGGGLKPGTPTNMSIPLMMGLLISSPMRYYGRHLNVTY